ncbi:g6538 [Coccomyxa elongata]
MSFLSQLNATIGFRTICSAHQIGYRKSGAGIASLPTYAISLDVSSSLHRKRQRLLPVRCSSSGQDQGNGRVQDASPLSASSPGNMDQPSLQSNIIKESDAAFLLKLLILSFSGSAVIKYGSPLLDTPFQPSLPLAITIICAPCIAFALLLSLKSKEPM